MPFKSEKQRKFLWANEPEIAEKWSKEDGKPRRERTRSKRSRKRKNKRKGRVSE